MTDDTFPALVVRRTDGGQAADIEQISLNDLPEDGVLLRVTHSTVNYKDGLAVTGTGKVIRSYPMVPGIDLAGRVEESTDDRFRAGETVFSTGWGLGEDRWGGYARYERVPADVLQRLPDGFDGFDVMALGSAGFTAILCVMALEHHGFPREGPVVVTGATGGVGSVAVALLAAAGHEVVASTGKADAHDYLRSLGAREVIDRSAFTEPARGPLGSRRWQGAVDTVGGETLAGLLRQMDYRSGVAAVGNAGGGSLETTVYPFILRAVALLGVESVYVPMDQRVAAWERLARDLPPDLIRSMTETIPLSGVPAAAESIVAGKIRGRRVVELDR
jgi:acrylyl-CoA reductase (NADPH)